MIYPNKPDYSELNINTINEKKYSHVKLLLGWVFYFAGYLLTENLIPIEKCHVIHCSLDDMIPFNEHFLIFYFFWYIFIAGSLVYFFFYDVQSFTKLQIFLIVTQVIAIAVYIIYPSVQIGRPETLDDTFLCNVAKWLYSVDTPTGVCPSLHVAYSIGIASVWAKKKRVSLPFKILIFTLALLISASVVFVKQHSVIDIIAAIPLGMIAEYIAYTRKYKALNRLIKRKILKGEKR